MKYRFFLIFPMLALWMSGCSDPLSDNENIVRTLISGPLQAGQYSVFWDGTDDKDNFVEAGQYVALLYTRNFTLIDTLNALPGTEEKYNRNDYYNDVPVLMDEMYDNEPDPFYIEDGTNLRFGISSETSVRLTIQIPEND